MWIVEQKDGCVLGVDLCIQDNNYTIFPVFTDPDAAIAFIGELDNEDDSIRMHNINSIDLIKQLINTIKSSQIHMIALNLPNINDITSGTEIVHCQIDEFINLLEYAVNVSDKYDEKHIINTLNKYLYNIVQPTDTQ